MNIRRAEQVTGFRIEVGVDNAGAFAMAYDGDVLVKVMRSKRDVKDATRLLVEDLYREECGKVFQAQGWKCARCGRFRPLQGHHKVHRSKGRVDKGNLEGLCAACHGKEHGG